MNIKTAKKDMVVSVVLSSVTAGWGKRFSRTFVKGALQNKFPIKLFQTSEQLEDYLYGSANAIGGIDFHLDFSVSWDLNISL